jgi:hypothetical protein
MAASGKIRNDIRDLEVLQKEEYSPERQDRIEFLACCLDDAEQEEREMREEDREESRWLYED